LIPARKGRRQEISVACGGRIPADDANVGGKHLRCDIGPEFARKLAPIIAEIMRQGVTLNVRVGQLPWEQQELMVVAVAVAVAVAAVC
jgi:hypothetical protein